MGYFSGSITHNADFELIMPVINLLGIASLLAYFNENAWMGFLRGVVLTALSVLVTMFFTRIKYFWRT